MVRRSSAGSKPPTAKEIAHAAAVQVEELKSSFRMVVEAVTGFESRFDGKLAELRAEVRDEIRTLGAAARQHSADIRSLQATVAENSADIRSLQATVAENSADIRSLQAGTADNTAGTQAMRTELAAFRHDFDHREERGRVSALEARVTAIETRLAAAR